MNEGWKSWVTLVGGAASVAVLATTFCTPAFVDWDGSGEETWAQEYRFNPWASDQTEKIEEEVEETIEAPEDKALWVRFVTPEDETLEADVLLSAPGMWPFVTKHTRKGGFMELPSNPSEMLNGQELRMYEVVVRPQDSEDGNLGYWGLIHGPEERLVAEDAPMVRLTEAHTLNLEVVDEEGAPIEGAFARLSRDSVGLLHLNYTTRDDGLARFRNLPRGTYYLTLDADGYARNTVTIEHRAEISSALQVTLQDGSGLRLPQSWRGPPVQELAKSSGTSSGSTSSGAADGGSEDSSASGAGMGRQGGSDGSGSQGEADEESTQGIVPVEVYVATSRGSGVDGAWIEAWSDGRRVAQGRSRGNSAEVLHVPSNSQVEVIATHAGWGEGSKMVVDADGGDDMVVRLTSELLYSTDANDRMRGATDIEDALDVRLVRDGRRWLIDLPNLDSPAVQSGIERGDSLLFVRRDGAGHLAVVERNDQIVEVSIP